MSDIKRTLVAMEKEASPFFVRGITIMHHRIRIKLKLTFEEYAFLDFIKMYQTNGEGRITYSKVYANTGILPARIPDLFRKLKDNGFLYRHESGVVTTTTKWDECFSRDDDFEKIWKMNKCGNRIKALAAFDKAIKVIPYDELVEKYKQYLKYCEETGTYTMHASSFFNPKFKHWENEEYYNGKHKKLIKTSQEQNIPNTTLENEW